MESEDYKRFLALEIKNEVNRQRWSGKLTSKGEKMSLSAIGRTLEPPVTPTSMYDVRDGRSESRRIKEAIHRELGKAYWMLPASAKASAGKKEAA